MALKLFSAPTAVSLVIAIITALFVSVYSDVNVIERIYMLNVDSISLLSWLLSSTIYTSTPSRSILV